MHARVTRLEVPIEKLEADIATTREIAREVEETPGGLGLFYLVDRSTGKTMAITLWESEQAMRDSEGLAADVTGKRQAEASAKVVTQERYEVVAEPRG